MYVVIPYIDNHHVYCLVQDCREKQNHMVAEY